MVSIRFGAHANIAAAFDPGSGYPQSYWIGAIQDPLGDEPDQGWDWVDEQLLFQASWLSGEPDDGSSGACPPTNCMDHDVAVMSFPAAGTNGMADDSATVLHVGLIQRPTTAACDPLADTARNFERTFAWQFRYDSPRGRYMRRMLDPDTLAEVLTDWTVYEGNSAVSDFVDDGATADTQRHYFRATGHADVDSNGDWDTEAWFFRNLIGSTELARGATGLESLHLAYTAFGEEYDLTSGAGVATRYRYAGAWGYQSHDDFPMLHVGARWYDPETGRFLQRDPIGIDGGLNVYAYAANLPTVLVDPDGLIWGAVIKGIIKGGKWIVKKLAKKKPKPKPSSKFKPPTNPPQKPPSDLPPGVRVRIGKPTEQYPSGYWRMEKLQRDGKWQYVNPSTMKPGLRCDTHIPLLPPS